MPTIHQGQSVRIENKDQFEAFYPQMRSACNMPFREWWNDYGDFLNFPIYLAWVNSIFGVSLGYQLKPTPDVITGEPLDPISFEQACKQDIRDSQ